MSTRPLVLVTEPLAEAPARWLAQRAEVLLASDQSSEFRAAAPRAEALVVRTYTMVDDALLSGMPALRVVGRAGVGLDNIRLEDCARRGVAVVNTPDANTQAVVEFVFASLLDALRPRVRLERAVDAREWNDLRRLTVGDRQLGDLRWGVLGFGRIGSRVARVARALGCEVRFNDLRDIAPEARHGAEPCDAASLFAESDVVTVHVDGRDSNRGFVGLSLLARMKPDALLVNTSRGMVVDAEALASELRAHPARTAILDVHEPEPIVKESPLLALPNARLSPHLASRTVPAMEAMSWVVRDVWAVLEGRPPEWPARPDGHG